MVSTFLKKFLSYLKKTAYKRKEGKNNKVYTQNKGKYTCTFIDTKKEKNGEERDYFLLELKRAYYRNDLCRVLKQKTHRM